LIEHGADLRATAVNDHSICTRLAKQGHILRKGFMKRCFAHRIAAKLHHDTRTGITLHIGQSLGDNLCLF